MGTDQTSGSQVSDSEAPSHAAQRTENARVAGGSDDQRSGELGHSQRRRPPKPARDCADPYGLDSEFERAAIPALDWLYRVYFRVEHQGIEHIPDAGRCLIVANHSGTLPLDGLMLRTLMRLEHPSGRELRWLTSDFIHSVPLIGTLLMRLGAVRESQTDAERLVRAESLVVVFPEGIDGIGKLYRDRYRLRRFGGGFIRLALRTETPLIPCAIIGAEETSPLLYRLELLPRLFGLPYVPVTPTFPWLGPAGLMPAPTKWKIVFGPPVALPDCDPGAERDPRLVAELSNRVRDAIQAQLDTELSRRRTIWRG